MFLPPLVVRGSAVVVMIERAITDAGFPKIKFLASYYRNLEMSYLSREDKPMPLWRCLIST